MAHNKLYRNFIILQEDEKTHAASGEKALSGYAKIEAKSDKCKISFYAQNLKKEEDYSIVLICYKKDTKQIVDLGSLIIKDEGKGEVSKDYYVNNIAGLDFSYEKISGAAVCKNTDGKLKFLMYGFMSGENITDDWKKCKVIKHNDKCEEVKEKQEIHKVHKEIKKEEKKIEAIKAEVIMEVKKPKKSEYDDEEFADQSTKEGCECSKPCEGEINQMYEKMKIKQMHKIHEHDKDIEYCEKHEDHKEHEKHEDHKEHEKHEKCEEHKEHEVYEKCCHKSKNDDHDFCHECDKECKEICHKREDVRADFDSYESNIQEEREIDPYDFELSGAMGAFFEDITTGFEEYRNKCKEIKYCKWYKVKINSLDDMCNISNYNKYTLAYYPMINYYPYIKKHGHFIMGYKCEKKGELKYIVYGVPGRKNKEDQPYAGKTGFVTWMNSEDSNMGYWLMFYDYKKSIIVVPMK